MRLKTSLYLSVAAIGVAVLLSTPAAQLRRAAERAARCQRR